MTKKIDPYIIKKDEFGNEYTIDNIEYKKKISKEKYELFLKKSDIPPFYWNIDFKDYKGDKDSKEIKQIIYYAENCHKEKFKHVNLYLWGIQSTQKTAISCNILKTVIKNGLKVKFILAGTLISCLLKMQGFSKDEEADLKIKELKECDLILIDDIGDINKSTYWIKSSNLVCAAWDEFLREILSSNTKVIMTSNFDISIFKQHYGDSLHELIDRNFMKIQLTQSVKKIRQHNIEDLFKDF
jgi:DNA replication protein DnaC